MVYLVFSCSCILFGAMSLSSPAAAATITTHNEKKERIETLFYQITQGCGDSACPNQYCGLPDVDPNAAATMSLKLYNDKNVKVCISKSRIKQLMIRKQSSKDENLCQEENSSNVEMDECDVNIEVSPKIPQGEPLLDENICQGENSSNIEMDESDINIEVCSMQSNIKQGKTVGAPMETSCCAAPCEVRTKPPCNNAGDCPEVANMQVSTDEGQHDSSANTSCRNPLEEQSYSVIERFMAGEENLSLNDICSSFTTIFSDIVSTNNLFVAEKQKTPHQDCSELRQTMLSKLKSSTQQEKVECARKSCLKSDYKFENWSPFFPPTCNHLLLKQLNQVIKWYGSTELECTIVEAIDVCMKRCLKSELHCFRLFNLRTNALNVFAIFLDNVSLLNPVALSSAIISYCNVLVHLPLEAQERLVRYWKNYTSEELIRYVELFQQQLVYQILTEWSDDDIDLEEFHNDHVIHIMVKSLHVLYLTSVLGGEHKRVLDEVGNKASKDLLESYRDQYFQSYMSHYNEDDHDEFVYLWKHPLARRLDIDRLDVVKPLIPSHHFVNHDVNRLINIDSDYKNYRTHFSGETFSFISYSFFLSLENKISYLSTDVYVRMWASRREGLFAALLSGANHSQPQRLNINVRRSDIINDALLQIELAIENMENFNKPLHVEFDGEPGFDEGGLSKEFFMVIIEKMLTPDHGVFVYEEESRLFWFNIHSFETESQYRLIGIILGLAINNNCILNIAFPRFVYKKLLGYKALFHDMRQLYPTIHSSLKSLLDYDGDVANDLMTTFTAEYNDFLGIRHTYELKPDQPGLEVTNENRHEYVELYTDWLLNTSVTKQFNAFRGGFDLVCNRSPIRYLFNDEELEILICGKESLELEELETTARYDGFTKNCQTIRDFWETLRELSVDERKKFLVFLTGCDRVPVGGLAGLKMSLVRNGDRQESLPTAHTCFNAILLPDYKNKDTLKERLLKALTHSKGFGLI